MRHSWVQKKLAPALRPLSRIYALGMKLRAGAYACGILPSRMPRAFCVSVGNIAWGGTGKTPLTGWILRWAQDQGLVPAVLSRGYGGKTEERPLLVKPWTSPAEGGDEPVMLARAHPEVSVLSDPSRVRALEWLEANSRANFIVLDDAMQHLALRRNCNLVLLRGNDLTEDWGRVLPWGSWREGAGALERADAFLLRAAPGECPDLAAKADRLPAGKPVFSFDLIPTDILPLGADASGTIPGKPPGAILETLRSEGYALAAAVANPVSVRKGMSSLIGQPPAREFLFPDHYRFKTADLHTMRQSNLPVIFTAKDAVKIRPLLEDRDGKHCFILESAVRFGPILRGSEDFAAWLARRHAYAAGR